MTPMTRMTSPGHSQLRRLWARCLSFGRIWKSLNQTKVGHQQFEDLTMWNSLTEVAAQASITCAPFGGSNAIAGKAEAFCWKTRAPSSNMSTLETTKTCHFSTACPCYMKMYTMYKYVKNTFKKKRRKTQVSRSFLFWKKNPNVQVASSVDDWPMGRKTRSSGRWTSR